MPDQPTRTCIGCRQRFSVEYLTRIVRLPVGSLVFGSSLEGRGAWLCSSSASCVILAAKRNAFARAFRVPVSIAAVAQFVSALVPSGVVRDNKNRLMLTKEYDEGAG